MKGILKAKGRNLIVPEDSLSADVLGCRFQGQSGLPSAADKIAYDPVQRLFAFGTSDGRVKVSGSQGVEALLVSNDRSGTVSLTFMTGKGALLRVTQGGDIQLWGLTSHTLLDSIPCADPVLSVAQIPETPYICVGCRSGMLQFLQVNKASGDPSEGVAEAHSLELLPYELHADELDADGELSSLSVLRVGECQHLLGVHSTSGAFVWELRHQVCLARTALAGRAGEAADTDEDVQVELASAGPVRTACWIGAQAEAFATGHEMGQVFVWMIPLDASGNPPTSEVALQLLMKLSVSPPRELAMPVTELQYVEGDGRQLDSSLLIFGGQVLDQPPILTLASLDSSSHGKPSMQTLPWYGMIHGSVVIPHKGALTAAAPAAAIVALMEFGHLILFELPDLHPNPISLPLQELPELTLCLLTESAADSASHSVTVGNLRAAQKSDPLAATGQRWRWAFDGGKPARSPHSSTYCKCLLLTGHVDGRLRIWDGSSVAPELLVTVPFDSGGPGAKLKAVSAVNFCAMSGLLAVGHINGELRVYHFSASANEVAIYEATTRSQKRLSPDEDSGRRQPPGFQRILRLCHHSAKVTAVDIAASLGLLIIGDENGSVSAVDLIEPAILWKAKVCDQQVTHLTISQMSFDSQQPDNGTKSGQQEALSSLTQIVLVTSQPGGICALEATSGKRLGSKITPRTADRALWTAVLDNQGTLLPSLTAPLSLPWANNEEVSFKTAFAGSAAALRSGQNTAVSSPKSDMGGAFSPPRENLNLRAHRSAEILGQEGDVPRLSSSEDEDAYLASAAQNAESTRENVGKKHRLRSFLKDRLLDHKESKNNRESNGRGKFRQKDDEGVSELSSQDSRSEGLSKPTSFKVHSHPLHSGGSGRSFNSSAEAHFLVVATSSFVRLYPAESLQSGDRTTLKKVTLEEPCSVAQPFSVGGAPGLACLSASGYVQVFSLPGLELLLTQSIGAILGFPWSWDANLSTSLQQLCSVGPQGDVIASQKGGELVRFTLARSHTPLLQPATTYDWEVAKAAHAASHTAESQQSLSGELVESESPSSADAAAGNPLSADTGVPLRNAHAEQKKGLGGFIQNVRGGVVGVGGLVEGTGRELGKSFGGILGSKRESQSSHRSSAPALGRVLSSQKLATQKPSEGASVDRSNVRPSQSIRPGGRVQAGPIHAQKQSARGELLGSRERAPRRGLRTTQEIKEAYGRPTSKKSLSAAAIAANNVVKLEERGEKLGTINTKAEQMANDAKDFASMAKAIRDREANRRWWQM